MPLPVRRPLSSSRLPSRSILDDIVIDHGQIDVLGRFFLETEIAMRSRGIALQLCSPEELVAANLANTDNWKPLVPMCNPAYGLATPERCLSVIGRNTDGEVVTANSAVRYDWTSSDFRAEAESLRMFYSDPDTMRQPGEACEVTAPEAGQITGRAIYSGAAWVRPDYRNAGIAEYLPRFIKALAISRWPADVIFGIMAEAVQRHGHAPKFGYDHLAWEARWINSLWGGIYRMAILWTDVDFLGRDLRVTLDRLAAPQVDGGVLYGDAEQTHAAARRIEG